MMSLKQHLLSVSQISHVIDVLPLWKMFDAVELEVNHRQGEQITLKIKHYTRLTALVPLLSL